MRSNDIKKIVFDQYRISVEKINRFSQGVMNENYRLSTADGSWVLRVYGKKTEPETRVERFMLQTLASQDFPCPQPWKTAKQKDVILVGGKPAILYPCIQGTHPSHATPGLLKELGVLQGRLHQTLKNKKPPAKKTGWDPQDIKKLLPLWRPRIIKSKFPNATSFLDFISTELATCHFPKSLPRGLTHQDIKPENVLVKNNHVSGILDFDNAYVGVFLHDLTTTIIWWCFQKNYKLDRRLVNAFLKGYQSERRLTADEQRLLLTDGLRFRLLREMFIGPMTTLSHIPLATKRAGYFFKLYQNLY